MDRENRMKLTLQIRTKSNQKEMKKACLFMLETRSSEGTYHYNRRKRNNNSKLVSGG